MNSSDKRLTFGDFRALGLPGFIHFSDPRFSAVYWRRTWRQTRKTRVRLQDSNTDVVTLASYASTRSLHSIDAESLHYCSLHEWENWAVEG